MHDAAAAPAWVMLAYLVAGICFILALRGLSSPASSRRGNRFGMFGMALAVGTTLVHYFPRFEVGDGAPWLGDPDSVTLGEILAAIALGAAVGLVTARRIAMPARPELVAGFHSWVGRAAGLAAAPAFLNPHALETAGAGALSHAGSRLEM